MSKKLEYTLEPSPRGFNVVVQGQAIGEVREEGKGWVFDGCTGFILTAQGTAEALLYHHEKRATRAPLIAPWLAE